ncbi:hypothetical protein BD311DRAFT_118949 [Dichomitus squalens]|uniref:Uncharacterized protein n=1 Tax=Dichomitus squalens TaxID=114155 RepID=A0A4Q9MVX5_9APHY|nr:hypothetical protein BD311DRAFT_118949 [Dichomitus squalens]
MHHNARATVTHVLTRQASVPRHILSPTASCLPHLLPSAMAIRITYMPRIVCTGYELTDALRRYLEVGHGVDFAKELAIAIEQAALRAASIPKSTRTTLLTRRTRSTLPSNEKQRPS